MMYAVASALFGVQTKFTCERVALATVRSEGAFSDCAWIKAEPIIPIKNAKENCFIRMHLKDNGSNVSRLATKLAAVSPARNSERAFATGLAARKLSHTMALDGKLPNSDGHLVARRTVLASLEHIDRGENKSRLETKYSETSNWRTIPTGVLGSRIPIWQKS